MPGIVEETKEKVRRAPVGFEILQHFEGLPRLRRDLRQELLGALLTTTDEPEGSPLIRQLRSRGSRTRWMSTEREDAIFMHPLPADRNVEVTDGVTTVRSRRCMTRQKTACPARRPSWRSP